MTDSHQNNSKNRQDENPEDFKRFLQRLSPDPKEAGHRYNCLHKKLSDFFSFKGVPDPVNAADETLTRATLKISSDVNVPNVDHYCLGIARNIVKERLRLLHREQATFHKFIEDLSNSSAEQVERIHSILKPCFEQLEDEDRQLLLAYCQNLQGGARAEHRRQVAETMNMTMLNLRVQVARLRKSLTDCVRKRVH
jgi:hypothetical protein